MKTYDLCVIGAGPAGYAAAMRAVDFRKKVLLVEKDQLGGAGVNNGALWSKTWWELARKADALRTNAGLLNLGEVSFDFKSMKTEVSSALQERTRLLSRHMQNVNVSIGSGIFDYAHGVAKIVARDRVVIVSQHEDEAETIKADHIICATGSRPRKLPEIPIDEHHIYTSDGLDKLEQFPKSMVILGAGVIGCEFATIFSSFGETKVHLIDKGDRILPFEDEDVVAVIEKNLEENGVLIHRNSKLVDMEIVSGEVVYTLEYTDGRVEKFTVEKALVSVGRIPNHEDLFDHSVPVNMDARGIIDDLTQTSVPNIYAVGDITADISLVNVAELEGRHAVERIFGKPEQPLIYENISTIMFLKPEVAGVGMNEIQAQKEGLDYRMVTLGYDCIPRATAMRNTQGFIKIIISADDAMKILGMRVVGEHASSAIQAVALLISVGRGVQELAELIHPHPSIIEGIQECARMLMGKSILKPQVLGRGMTCRVYENGGYRDV